MPTPDNEGGSRLNASEIPYRCSARQVKDLSPSLRSRVNFAEKQVENALIIGEAVELPILRTSQEIQARVQRRLNRGATNFTVKLLHLNRRFRWSLHEWEDHLFYAGFMSFSFLSLKRGFFEADSFQRISTKGPCTPFQNVNCSVMITVYN